MWSGEFVKHSKRIRNRRRDCKRRENNSQVEMCHSKRFSFQTLLPDERMRDAADIMSKFQILKQDYLKLERSVAAEMHLHEYIT